MPKQAITLAATDLGQNWFLWVMGGLGISTMDVPQFFGGGCLAVAAASIMGRARKDPRKIWFLIFIAGVAAILTAAVWPQTGWATPVQVGMAAAGAASSWLINILVKVGNAVEGNTDTLAKRLIDAVLPKRGSDK